MTVSRNLWAKTGQGEACIMVDIYDLKIIAYASSERIMANELKAALEAEYGIAFETRTDVSPGSIHAVGMRVL